jgi:hypothetical protein
LDGDTTVLPPFIIDQIRRREQDHERRSEEQPTLEIPKAPPASRSGDADEDDDDRDRGVFIIDLG